MKSIRKVVIPVAGYGTRFLPATKALPKEMLPIVDEPTVQYIVEEAVASGIETVILVTSQSKRSIEDHFDENEELERHLSCAGKESLVECVRHVSREANFVYIRQRGPYGNGTPVLNAESIIGDEPFAVIWGDDLVRSTVPRLKQLIDVYEEYGHPVLTAYPVDDEGTSKYGIIDGSEVAPGVIKVEGVVEKPGPDDAPSRIASLGGYILTPDIFEALHATGTGKGGELWLIDAIFRLGRKRPIYARLIKGTYYDVGSKIGWLKANIAYALEREEMRGELDQFMRECLEKRGLLS